jgi:hypothetical protein
MKYVIITVRRSIDGTTAFPPGYDAQEVDKFTRGGMIRNGGLARGEETGEWLVCFMDDVVADKYIGMPFGRELTEAEADDWIASNPQELGRSQIEETDANMIRLIDLKLRMGKPLTQEEEDALDLDKPTPGFNRRKTKAKDRFQ